MSTALYRRYRPDTFADVIGQEHVTGPLVTALGKDSVSHAYLFSGPRGCGKTTSARILARCLNCAQGPTGTPCGQCESCRELATGGPGSLDVIEIDAASHGGVDDARDLRERATFAPVRDRYKIFIIDEAHMVTAAGFNALLKIVEEPPEHIKFIFATTEPDKVIGTIRSRTHHYPFRLVPPEPLLDYLERLCAAENVPVAPGVLQLVLRAGGGSVRDTLSVLDQLIAGSSTSGIDYERAVALLGFTHTTLLNDVVESVAALDGAQAFAVVDRVVQSGQDPRRFVEDLLERLRDLIIVSAVPENPAAILRGVPEDQIRAMQAQAQTLSSAELSRAADITATALTEMVGATSPRLHLELLMARLLLPHAEQGHSSLAARLERLERRMDFTSGAGVTPAAEAPSELTQAPAPSAADPRRAEQSASAGEATAPAREEPSADQAVETPAARSHDGWATPGVSWGDPATDAAPPPQQRPQAEVHPPRTEETPKPAPVQTGPASNSDAPAGSAGASRSGSSAEMMKRAWPDIVEAMKSRSRMLWMLVKGNVSIAGFDGKTLTLGFSNDGARATFANRSGDKALDEAIQEVLGFHVAFELVTGSAPPSGGGEPPKAESRPEESSSAPAESTTRGPGTQGERSLKTTAPAAVEPSDRTNATPHASERVEPGEGDHAAPSVATAQSAGSPDRAAPPASPAPQASPVPSTASSDETPAEAPNAVAPSPKTPIPAFARRSDRPKPALADVASNKTPSPPNQREGVENTAGQAMGKNTAETEPPLSRAQAIRHRLASKRPAPQEPPADYYGEEPPDPMYDNSPPPDWAEAAPPSAEEDTPSEDDIQLEASGVFGRRAIERILGGVLLEERSLGDDTY